MEWIGDRRSTLGTGMSRTRQQAAGVLRIS